jgi:hypothetical protein
VWKLKHRFALGIASIGAPGLQFTGHIKWVFRYLYLAPPKTWESAPQVLSKWIVKITASIVVKFALGLDISEYQTMGHFWTHRRNIPMPKLLGAVCYNYIFMSYVEGDSLADLWLCLLPGPKSSVQSQLRRTLQCLRRMPLQYKYLRSRCVEINGGMFRVAEEAFQVKWNLKHS